jgi:hypothetical protein
MIVLGLILLTVLIVALPSLIGFAANGPDKSYVGVAYNIDDSLVYDSWVRQAADGHFFIRNLFTTDHQVPIQFNLLFLTVGWIVRLTGLSIPLTFYITRLAASAGLLWIIYRLYRYLIPNDPIARVAGFFMACLGSGLGWVYWPVWSDTNPGGFYPVDTWQPEALTFQSMAMSLLFPFSQILIVAVIFLMIHAQRTGKTRYAAWAGVITLVLGNIHSYDILNIGAVWFLYLAVMGIAERKFDQRSWHQAGLCALIGVPSPLYQYHMYLTDPVWHERVLAPTLSVPLKYYLLGWGLLFGFAVLFGVVFALRRFKPFEYFTDDKRSLILPACWFIAALGVSYLPHCSFQRKMIMGAAIPLTLLAGCGLSLITQSVSKVLRLALIAICVLATIPTSLLWIDRDVRHVVADRSETSTPPFISSDESAAFDWIRHNTPEDSAFLGPPSLMIFVPGWCDRGTYVSHWSETPRYADRVRELTTFLIDGMPDYARAQYLATCKVDYFVFPNSLEGQPANFRHRTGETYANFHSMSDILQPVYSNTELTVYKVLVPHSSE